MAQDLSELSSNWRKLQATLPPTKKSKSTSSNTKTHKHPWQRTEVKRRRDEQSSEAGPHKRRRMGSYQSAEEQSQESKVFKVSPVVDDKFLINQGLVEDAVAGKYIALDCEMVGVGPEPDNDSQLARVSITNYNGDLLYDSYVQPILEVTDYRTEYSGIREANLRKSIARPFKQVQQEVSTLLEGRIVVGHAIKNDFDVLVLNNHPRRDVRDTSKLPKYREIAGGRNPSLKKLAKQFLGLEVQGGEHSSIEDARTTMLLFRLEKDEFERENMRKFGKSSDARGKRGMLEGESNTCAASEKTLQALKRHKKLAKRKAKKR